jgi:branched-chain amino acid transport system ATP-binding protein
MLRVENLKKSFGKLMALSGVTFQIEKGELSAIIGPNGAGKTTLFNLLTGHLTAEKGKIFFKDKPISGLSPHDICRMGIGRSFQITNIFPRLSAYENVQVAVMSWKRKSRNIFSPASKMVREETDEIVESVGLGDKKEVTAGLLAHGDQRRLEVGIALGSHPELLLLDEPTAGMSPEESRNMMDFVQSLARTRGLTIVFIEHDMSVVFGVSEKIRVMHNGTIIAEGSPEEVRSNDEVQKVYLAEDA